MLGHSNSDVRVDGIGCLTYKAENQAESCRIVMLAKRKCSDFIIGAFFLENKNEF